jgi:XTP/dITP diphosphohydrolase
MLRLLIATHNRGKQKEYRELLCSLPIELCIPSDLGLSLDVAENGSTYMENAVNKATTFQQASGLVTIADDSGLEVDALGGMPGVRSRRYGDPGDDDTTRYERLLRALRETPWPERGARFICALALATSAGELRRATGVCEGRITLAPRGENGFGYDPVFLVAEQGLTMAELPPGLKNRISHRARAVQALFPILTDLAENHSQRLDRRWAC